MFKLNEYKNKILEGNVLDVLKDIPDESLDCSISSPPYYALRDYQAGKSYVWDGVPNCKHVWGTSLKFSGNYPGNKDRTKSIEYQGLKGDAENEKYKFTKNAGAGKFCQKCGAWMGQLGLEPQFNLYIKHLCDIYDQVFRVLKKEGSCWVNLGDTYMSNGSSSAPTITKGRKKGKYVGDAGDKAFTTKKADKSLPHKCLCQIPNRFAIEMCNRGWSLRNEVIWVKKSCMPFSGKDRFTVDHEKFFFFTKSRHYYFKQQLEVAKWAETDPRSKGIDFSNNDKTKTSKGKYAMQKSGKYTDGGMKNKRGTWILGPDPVKESHFATYPRDLVRTPMDACCPDDGITLDPFMGSGTTGCVAREQNKNYVGVDINADFIKIAQKRIRNVATPLF